MHMLTCNNQQKLQTQLQKMILGNLKQWYSKWKKVSDSWKEKEPIWMRIDPLQKNNKVDEDMEYLIVETIKGWTHKGMIGDLPILETGWKSKYGLILIIIRSFKFVIMQVWVNRCKQFAEWEYK